MSDPSSPRRRPPTAGSGSGPIPKPPRVLPGDAIPASIIVGEALERSRDVEVQVEACADDLNTVNVTVKQHLVDGSAPDAIETSLATSEAIEEKVQASADELHQVNETLADGIADLEQTRCTLRLYKQALVASDAALVEAKAGEREAQQRAFTDVTTGLPNRALFDDRLTQAISIAERNGWLLAVLFFDLDRFKLINDTHGHAAGDAVLCEVARRLQAHCRDTDTLCRHGGDEFLYLLANPQDRASVARIAAAVIARIAEPIAHGAVQLQVNSSVGIALYPEHAVDATELIACADGAMYEAKRQSQSYRFA